MNKNGSGNLRFRLLNLFFHWLYQPLAFLYDAVAAVVSLGRWRKWITAVIPYLHGQSLLELGYGPGHLQLELVKKGYALFGLDASPQMARQAARKYRRAGLAVRAARGRAQALPFPAQTFDTVFATFPSPYISNPDTLAEVRRVLQPGGKLLVLLAAWITGKSLSDRAVALLFRITGETPSLPAVERLAAPYRQAGFTVELHWIEQAGSRLLLVEAHNPGVEPAS